MSQTIVKERHLLDRYGLTESLNSILNGLLAFTMRERRTELKKNQSNPLRIAELEALRNEVSAVNDNPDSFESLERMEELIDHYSPILQAAKKKAL